VGYLDSVIMLSLSLFICLNLIIVHMLDKIMETLQILYTFVYQYGVGPPLCLQYKLNLS
jgi:hypothetical protein